MMSKFGGFWDSVIDRFSDIALFIGLIYLYSSHGRGPTTRWWRRSR